MFNATTPRVYRLIGALGVLTLLSILGAVLIHQNSVRPAYATEPASKGGMELTGGREESLHALEAGKENGSGGPELWTSSQVQQPADLAKELSDPKSKKPLIICVGFRSLYQSAHIPGAVFHGPAANPEGLEDLKRWAQNATRETSIVLYCGCCPWNRCPNIRPAFKALHDMGFARLKVLSIGTDFATDWVQKGFPVERGK